MKSTTLAILIAGLSSLALANDGEPSATPSRPTVTSGASISEPGWLELELGLQRTGAEPGARRDSLPYLLKYSVNSHWAVWLGGEAQIRDRTPEVTERGFGDTVITVKHKADLGEGPISAGVEVSVKAPTADENKGLGSGKQDYAVRGIYGIDLPAGYHYDANLGVTRLGGQDQDVGRNSYLIANAVSRPLSDRTTIAADLSAVAQKGTKPVSQLLVAVSYAYSKRTVFDAGAQFGISSNAPDWTMFAGVTILLGKL